MSAIKHGPAQFTYAIEGHLATFTLTITAQRRAVWDVEYCGQAQRFTFHDFWRRGGSWLRRAKKAHTS